MLYDNIDYYLKAKGKSIFWLSKESGVEDTTLYRLKNGRRSSVSFDVAAKLAKALDITLDELYYGHDIKHDQ